MTNARVATKYIAPEHTTLGADLPFSEAARFVICQTLQGCICLCSLTVGADRETRNPGPQQPNLG